jgi:hypothetical protein
MALAMTFALQLIALFIAVDGDGTACTNLHERFFDSDSAGYWSKASAKHNTFSGAMAVAYRGGAFKPFASAFSQSARYCTLTYCPGTRSAHREVEPKTFVEAEALCSSLGLRLCSHDELVAQLAPSKEAAACHDCGCENRGGEGHWTSSSAPYCQDGKKWTGSAGIRGSCLDPTATLGQDTRCCADLPSVFQHAKVTYGRGPFSMSRYFFDGNSHYLHLN